MVEIHRTGFTQLTGKGAPRYGPCRANIIFVHGLGGHPRKTWEDTPIKPPAPGKLDRFRAALRSTSRTKRADDQNTGSGSTSSTSSNVFWPNDFLVDDLPEARVWTYGYNADVIGFFQAGNKNSISQHGRDLSVEIERDVMARNKEPIVFVAHSLGGIIVKDAIHRSETCRQRCRLVIFLGTPHRGAGIADWGKIAANLAVMALQDSNKSILDTLKVDSEVLDNIQENFINLLDKGGIKVHSFYETKGITGIKGLHGKVVNDFSSKLGLSQTIETVESIDADHRQMARCKCRTDSQYRKIHGVLKEFLLAGAPNGDGLMLQDSGLSSGGIAEIDPPVAIGALQPCHYIPMPRNPRFVGREAELDTLRQKLLRNDAVRNTALVGLGGMGKTQVALRLAYWVKDNEPEYSIFWVPALSEATFEQACAEIVKKLASGKSSGDENPKRLLRDYLNSPVAGKWLLVVDNADDHNLLSGSLANYLPESECGRTLFTTRSRKVAVDAAGSDVVELDKMSPQDAVSHLKESLIRKDAIRNSPDVEELLSELEYLPLAITQAAAYLNENQISVVEYLGLLRGTQQDMVSLMSREFRDKTRYKGSQNAVATTWLVSFEQIRRSESAAADLLAFISRIQPKAIPRSLLPQCESREEMTRAIGTLCAYSFLNNRGENKVFDMHSLVHMATRVWVDQCGHTTQEAEKAIRHVRNVFPDYEHENRFVWREYMPHAIKMLQDPEGQDVEERYRLCLSVGLCLWRDGRIKEAIKALEQCHQWRSSQYPEDHPDRLFSQHELAIAYDSNGQVKEAVDLLKYVVEVKGRVLAEDHPSRLASQHVLATTYMASGQVTWAIELLENVVKLQAQIYDEGHPYLSLSRDALKEAYATLKSGGKRLEKGSGTGGS
ncbi:putative kinesin light chain [Triangularia verruculosa]|uniref:Kinesin light chain n=1 Tax=Triangularia verruculosa TaxID=2587418 RepID=A0AAN6XDB8_9PEZI|nr:putative kinesin light chain [Triangularia verruculosa]